jgi:hypothetical protein
MWPWFGSRLNDYYTTLMQTVKKTKHKLSACLPRVSNCMLRGFLSWKLEWHGDISINVFYKESTCGCKGEPVCVSETDGTCCVLCVGRDEHSGNRVDDSLPFRLSTTVFQPESSQSQDLATLHVPASPSQSAELYFYMNHFQSINTPVQSSLYSRKLGKFYLKQISTYTEMW